jgi:hypothetical protein
MPYFWTSQKPSIKFPTDVFSWNSTTLESASVLMGLYRRQSCSRCDTRWHVVYVNEKKQGTKDSALGDARSHFALCRVIAFEDYFLGATGEKVCNPRQSITSHSRVVEFQEKMSVGNFKVPGRCHLILTSVRYYASPTSVIRSWQIIISTANNFKSSTTPNTSALPSPKSFVEQSRKQHHEEGKFHPSLSSTQHLKLPTES